MQLLNLFMAVIIEQYERHAEMADWDLAPHVGAQNGVASTPAARAHDRLTPADAG